MMFASASSCVPRSLLLTTSTSAASGALRRSSPALCAVASRCASTFSYVTPGKVRPRVHDLVFDEAQREERWNEGSLPSHVERRGSAQPAAAVLDGEAPLTPSRARELALSLRDQHPDTFLPHVMKRLLENQYGKGVFGVPSSSSSSPSSSPSALDALLSHTLTAEESSSSATEAGRVSLFALARQSIEELDRQCAYAEMQEADGRLALLPLDPRAKALIRQVIYGRVALATVKAARAINVAQAARFRSLPPADAAAEERAWLSSLGFGPEATPSPPSSSAAAGAGTSPSPHIPAELFAAVEKPLDTPMTTEERRNDTHFLDHALTKRLAMEHRDRAEVISRRKLPTPLHVGAPDKQMEIVARTLEDNPSLSPRDREYMLSIYAKAVSQTQTEMLDERRLVDPAEGKAWEATQPQWGWYDPSFPSLQDDAYDALAGRGKFSQYRGNTFRQEQLPPESYGESRVGSAAGSIGTPLETVEEVALASEAAERRLAAESAAATAAVTAALQRAMGLPVRSQQPKKSSGSSAAAAAAAAGSGSFFARLAAGYTPPSPSPPAGGNRIDLPRVEAAAAGGGGAKGGKPGAKGGAKGAAPAAGGKGGAAAKPAAKK